MTAQQRVPNRVPPSPASEPAPPDRDDAPARGASTSASSHLADISRLGRLFGRVVAPATLLTGLLFYFGWTFTYWYFHYLGVSSTLLGPTTQDYLMRSVEPLFIPVSAAALTALAVLWGRAAMPERLSSAWRNRFGRYNVQLSALAGLAAIATAVAAVINESLGRRLFIGPLGLVFGVFLLAHAVHVQRSRRGDTPARRPDVIDWRALTEWAGVFTLVGIGLFWAVTDYASAAGRTRAQEYERSLSKEPYAVVFSDRSLSLRDPGVTEVRCSDPDAAYRFRYDGLVLVLESGGQYLLLPRDWSPGRAAVVVPKSDSLRLEFLWGPLPQDARSC